MIDDASALRKLRHNDPPLYLPCDLEVMKYLCELDPSCLHQLDDNNRLPIHCAIHHEQEKKKIGLGWLGGCGCYNKFHYNRIYCLIERSVSHSPADESVGGLFTTMENGHLVLDCMVDNFGKENAWNAIKR